MTSLARLVLIIGAASLFIDCGGSQPSMVAPVAMPQQQMQPEASSSDLLYATATADQYVYVMSYPKIAVQQKLGPFTGTGPEALCADSSYVYVVVPGPPSKNGRSTPGQVYVYKHGATTATRVLNGPIGERHCAVDPASNDLALLTNYGELYIYRHSSGTPKTYNLGYYGVCDAAYGDRGKLYVAAGCSTLAEFVDGGLRYFSIGQRIIGPLHIQWNDGLIVATTYARGWPSDYHQDVYLIKPEAAHRATVQLVELDRKKRELPARTTASWVDGDAIFAPDHLTGALNFWSFPQGGEPNRYVRVKSIDARFTNLVISTGS